ncbi:YkoP family protein [Bacillus taeanensis]|uniref:YkoP-like domain-containing protein n=1 Tax=Bacillus taeanensis TaxID=273032 RepID=A0A366XRK2_9BACI|nr:hypothetical protein [Bacillus taeanensis]RBW68326.1 hypothetical protein DS031_17560 [Bacillus taeanensis]
MKDHLLTIWNILDPIYYMFTRLTYLDKGMDGKNNIFRVRLTRYRGRNVTLFDGTQIKKNDLLVKIHLHNVRLIHEMKHIKGEIRKGRFICKCVESSLPGLVTYINSHEKNGEIKGIVGITSLTTGSRRLGFESFYIINPFYKWFKSIAHLPICLLSSVSSFSAIKKQFPKYLFMSKEMLLQKYGS